MIDAGRRAARNSIGDALRRVTAKNRTKPALIWKDRSWTFESLETASLRVAERLAIASRHLEEIQTPTFFSGWLARSPG